MARGQRINVKGATKADIEVMDMARSVNRAEARGEDVSAADKAMGKETKAETKDAAKADKAETKAETKTARENTKNNAATPEAAPTAKEERAAAQKLFDAADEEAQAGMINDASVRKSAFGY